ncbi:MAG TPA: hypothetical protein VF528_16105 [Pyrinomonadaceae bacterium]|jgi:hypothetical protein
MLERNGRSGVAFALVLLLLGSLTISCSALKKLSGGGGGIDEANKLVRSANEDLKEISKIAQSNKDQESRINKLLNSNDLPGAKQAMDDTVKAIDNGLERGKSAADKFEQASKLDVDQVYKDYLSLKTQSLRKTVEAFESLKKAITILRDNIGGTDKAALKKAQNDAVASGEKFDKLIAEAVKLDREADDIARKNPDKIKPAS